MLADNYKGQTLQMKLNNETAKSFVKGNTLSAQSQQITKIEPLNEHKNITRMDLSQNILRTSDSLQGLDMMVNLSWLNFSHNGLTSLQLSKTMEKLQVLNISHNMLQEFPNLSHFPNLKAVIANNNEISRIPAQYLPVSLNTLVLSNNKLEVVPDLSEKKSLVKLSLSHNLIKEFPKKLPDCLAELRLNGNKLMQTSNLPPKVNLLDLGNNAFTSLKDLQPLVSTHAGGMKCLKNLSIKGNQLEDVDSKTTLLQEWFPRLAILDNKPLKKQ